MRDPPCLGGPPSHFCVTLIMDRMQSCKEKPVEKFCYEFPKLYTQYMDKRRNVEVENIYSA